MAVIGVRGGERPGGFLLNSWGPEAHRGPRYPADAPGCGFWADADVLDRMLAQGDSWAFSRFVGFPAKRLEAGGWRRSLGCRTGFLLTLRQGRRWCFRSSLQAIPPATGGLSG